MQVPGINPAILRPVAAASPDLAAELLTPGRILKAEVISLFGDRVVLSFGRGIRLEAQTQVPLKEGQQVSVQVQQPAASAQAGSASLLLKLVESAIPGRELPGTGQTNTPGTPFWLPIPLPDGPQGWAQLHVEPDSPGRGSGQALPGARQVRIWWETPELGAVQVLLDGSTAGLAAFFTAVRATGRERIEAGLSDLQGRLGALGFPETRLACRQAVPGEPVEPIRPGGPTRLDTRL